MIWPLRNLYHPEPGILSEVLVSREMKKWLLMLQYGEKRQRNFLREGWKSRIDNWGRGTFRIRDVLVLVSRSISIWEWSMTPSLVFSEWTSTWCWKGLEAELVWEEDAKAELEPSIKFPRMRLWNGSRESTMEPFITDVFDRVGWCWEVI